MVVSEQHQALLGEIKKTLGTWRRFTVAIDGVDGSGKSTLSRYLAWQLNMPTIETDLLLDWERGGFNYREDDLRSLIDARHRHNRPVIVEGVFILKILKSLNLTPDYLVYVEKDGHFGASTLQEEFASYESRHRKKTTTNFEFRWAEGG